MQFRLVDDPPPARTAGIAIESPPTRTRNDELARAWGAAGRGWVYSVPPMISATRFAGASSTSWQVARRGDPCRGGTAWAIEVLLGSGYRSAPAGQRSREHISAGVAAGPDTRSQVRDVGPAQQRHRRRSAGAISARLASSPMARARGVHVDQAWPRFRGFSAMTLRQRLHRRRRPAVRSGRSSAGRTVPGPAPALVDGSGSVMAENGLTFRRIMTLRQPDLLERGF